MSGHKGSASSSSPLSGTAKLSRRLGAAIFYAALSLILLTAIPYGTVETWSIALFEIIVFTLGALWMAEGALGGGFWLRREHASLLAPLVLVSLYAYLQSVVPVGVTPLNLREVISADPYETRLFALQFFALTTFAALLLRYTTNRRRLLALVLTVIAVGITCALFGIIRQTAQRAGEQGFVLPSLTGGVGYAQFVGRNSFAFLMEMTLGLGLGLLAGVARQRIMLVVASLLPLWTALVLCNSRGGILSMLAQVIFAPLLYLIARPSTRRRKEGRDAPPGSEWEVETSGWQRLSGSVLFKGALVFTLLVVTLTGTIWMGGAPLADRLETVSGELNPEAADPTGASRRDIWRSTLNLIKARPLAGSGFGAYWIAISPHHEGSGALSPQQAHNDYLELAAGGGLFGALLFLCFIYLFVKRARLQLRSPERFRRAVCFGALVGLFGVSVHSLVDFGLHVTVNALVCLALVAIATANVEAAGDNPGAANLRRPHG
ncbi:MAG TPA: O-antigen ligase family protein [Pyrinomonadaceae bacterium]